MTKYIVSGYIGFDNFGDEMIAHILTNKLKSEKAEKITLISSNPSKTKEIHNTDSCSMFGFLLSLIESDVLISGGGSLLQDVTSLKSLIYYLGVIFTALFLGKKVEIFAQGIGPINSKLGIFLTKFALKHCHKISVRDKKSQNLLKSWNIDSDLINDPVLEMHIDNKNIKEGVGIQLRNIQGLSNDFLRELAKEVSTRFSDKNIKIISLQDSVDMEVCNKFGSFLKEYGINNVVIVSGLKIYDVIETISSLEYLIAMRFHANVIGIKSNVKTLAINYDPKVENLAEMYNIPIIKVNSSNFAEQFNKLIG